MSLLDLCDGVGMSREAYEIHSKLAAYITTWFVKKLEAQGKDENFWCTPENPATKDKNGKTPDISIVDSNSIPYVIIEITNQKMAKQMIQKCKEEYLPLFPNAELFVLNYTKTEWTSIHNNDLESDYCKFINGSIDDAIPWEKLKKVHSASFEERTNP
ncbi:MAG: hypothetical protein MJZ28_02910 [Paludibacteraceae bacterium]|nr:hypothetical protein [Paludibacteraceae bacterium]